MKVLLCLPRRNITQHAPLIEDAECVSILQHSSETTLSYVLDVIRQRRRRADRLSPITANVQENVKLRATQLWAPVTCTTSCTLPDALPPRACHNLVFKPLHSCAPRDRDVTFRQDHVCDSCLQSPPFMAHSPDRVSHHTDVCESLSAITRSNPRQTRVSRAPLVLTCQTQVLTDATILRPGVATTPRHTRVRHN